MLFWFAVVFCGGLATAWFMAMFTDGINIRHLAAISMFGAALAWVMVWVGIAHSDWNIWAAGYTVDYGEPLRIGIPALTTVPGATGTPTWIVAPTRVPRGG